MAGNAIIPPAPADDGGSGAAQDARAGGTGTAAAPKPARLEGVTSIDDKVFLECEMLAYASVERIAELIAAEAAAATPAGASRIVVLVDDELFAALRLFASLKLQLGLFEKGFAAVAPAPAAAALPRIAVAVAPALAVAGATAAVEGVVNLLGLFRQDTKFSGRTVSIKETALYLELAHALRGQAFEVRYPRLLTYRLSSDPQPSEPILTDLFDEVVSERQKAVERLRPLLQTVAELERRILERRREFEKADAARQAAITADIQSAEAQLVTARKNLDPDLVLFENTDVQWNDLQKGLSRADPASALTPMQVLVRAADVLALFTPGGSPMYFCYATAVVAGGSMRTRRNLWQTLFHGDALEFSGGAVVSYALFDDAAKLVAGRTLRHMTPFRGFRTGAAAWTNVNTDSA